MKREGAKEKKGFKVEAKDWERGVVGGKGIKRN